MPAILGRTLATWIGAGLFVAFATVAFLSTAVAEHHTEESDAATAAVAPPGEDSVQLAVFAPQGDALPAAPADPARHVTRGEIRKGDSLASSFGREGVDAALASRVARQMRIHFHFRRQARPGHTWELVEDAEGNLVEFRYLTSPTASYLLRYEQGDPVVTKEEVELVARPARIAGVVTDTLYAAIRNLGEDPQLARDFAEIFAWDVDFTRTVQRGDEFRILYERLYRRDADGNEHYARPGLILAARYAGAAGEHTAIYFEPGAGRGAYYRPDGRSVRGPFLLAPLRFSRISSHYSQARRHPILNVTRPHHGIDYAAPAGTPVWSVADGQVIYRGWAGGFGNLVKIRHRTGHVSYYAHLSRFAKGLRVGDSVRQKQTIGFVGQTGLATGPHVCFRVAKDGRYVNPATMRIPSNEAVPPTVFGTFSLRRDVLLGELDSGHLVATDEAL